VRRDTHSIHRKGNALVLSEALEENAVKVLVNVALSNIFSEQCSKWHAAKKDIRERSDNELIERQEAVCENLAREEYALQGILREAVVRDVVKLFPWVFFLASPSTEC
jgi:hypothetical protein